MELTFLPCLDHDFPCSPLLSHVNASTRAFMQKHHLKYVEELTLLAAIVYPHLNYKQLCLANYVHIFLWVFDDFVDEPGVSIQEKMNLVNRCKTVLKHYQERKPSAYFNADALEQELKISFDTVLDENSSYGERIAIVFDKILFDFKDEFMLIYIVKQFFDYFDGVESHIHLKTGETLSVEEYEKIRLKDGACEVVWTLPFLDQPFEVISNYLESSDGKLARLCASRNVSYVNDGLSYNRDIRDGQNFNIVCCYMHERQVSKEDAVKIVSQLCNTSFESLTSLAVDSTSRTIVERLSHWCIGSAYWHHKAKRYHQSH
jgi:hypothetical protein